MLAWHFVGTALRDGAPIPQDGETLIFDGVPIPCEQGLHGSVRVIDALRYAPGGTLCRVRMGGVIEKERDKVCATERTILWRIDADNLLRAFARSCAFDVIHLWNAPDVVREYLKTGDNKLRAAASAAASAAAETAAWNAASAAASAAAWAAAWNAAWAAASAAAETAAWNAAWDTARDAQNAKLLNAISDHVASLGYAMEPV